MMKRIACLALAGLCFALTVGAQSADEAFRYSNLTFGGTARSMGVSGAFGAVGADYGAIAANPAGLGLYRSSEIMFTPRLEFIKSETRFNGERWNDDRFNFAASSVGLVFSIDSKKAGTKWRHFNFGIGYNRMANFFSNRLYRATGTGISVLPSYAAEFQGYPPQDLNYSDFSWESILGYDGYLVNPIAGDSTNYNTVTDGQEVDQEISVKTQGGYDEMTLSFAANYDHKLYFGFTLGVPFVRYEERYMLSEEVTTTDTVNGFRYFELRENLSTEGAGVNFQVGVLYRVNNYLRLGAAVKTPTYLGLNDNYNSNLYSVFDTISYNPASPAGEFEYGLATPWRFNGSLAVMLHKYGFVSFDYERVDFPKANYRFKDDFPAFEQQLNDDIDDTYRSANIFRVGLELAYDMFRVRGGYHYMTAPVDISAFGDYDGMRKGFSVGAGIRKRRFYVDFAFVRSTTQVVDLVVNESLGSDELTNDNYVLTVGYRFGQ